MYLKDNLQDKTTAPNQGHKSKLLYCCEELMLYNEVIPECLMIVQDDIS